MSAAPSTAHGLEGGSRWRDQATGCWIAASTPEADPELWEQYLQGALRSCRRHRLEWVLDVDAIRGGADTTLFFAAIDPKGRAVGGTRVVAPLRAPEDSHALEERIGNSGRAVLRQMIANRLPFGVVEAKSAWAKSHHYGSGALSRVLARAALPMMTLRGVQFVMASAAAHVLGQWRSSGGVVA